MAKKKRKIGKVSVKIDGKVIRRSVSYYTLAEFAEKKKKIEEEIIRQHTKTFENVSDAWLDSHEKEVQYYTYNSYKAPLRDLKEEFGDMLMQDISSIMFQSFLEKMASRGYAKQTIKLRKIVMNQIFDYAIFNEIVSYNPIKVCKIPKKAPTTVRTIPADNDILTIQAHSDSLIGLYCNLLMYTGLRREEALALKFDDIDYDKDIININKAVIFESNKPVLRQSLKSSAGIRTVPLLYPLKMILLEQGANQKEGFIFTVDGEILNKGRFDKAFNRYRKDNDIKCTSHQLRHYFATLCFDADLDEKDLQDIMGHSKISLTKEVYTHIRAQRREESKNKLNDFIRSGMIG